MYHCRLWWNRRGKKKIQGLWVSRGREEEGVFTWDLNLCFTDLDTTRNLIYPQPYTIAYTYTFSKGRGGLTGGKARKAMWKLRKRSLNGNSKSQKYGNISISKIKWTKLWDIFQASWKRLKKIQETLSSRLLRDGSVKHIKQTIENDYISVNKTMSLKFMN